MSNIIQRGTLSVLNQNDVVPADITQIIDSYKNLEKLGRSVSAIATERAGRRSLHPELIDVITNREMVVLLLVAERKTNKEIVQEFGISPETVKRHAVSLYRKLDVHNRRQAVVRARNLGILPAEQSTIFPQTSNSFPSSNHKLRPRVSNFFLLSKRTDDKNRSTSSV